jgi:uncharacterized small protein (DUF1192 family)
MAGSTTGASTTGSRERIMDIEDLEPKNKLIKPKDLSGWNIEDLEDYIERMRAEIERAQAMIESKQDISSAADALFKR